MPFREMKSRVCTVEDRRLTRIVVAMTTNIVRKIFTVDDGAACGSMSGAMRRSALNAFRLLLRKATCKGRRSPIRYSRTESRVAGLLAGQRLAAKWIDKRWCVIECI
jgi:hypothetical protein